MKFATYKDGTRDGRLHIVSKDMQYTLPSTTCPTLQYALDNWDRVLADLQAEYDGLNTGQATGVLDFDSTLCHAPLPRAYQWVDGSAYVNHAHLARKAFGGELPESFWYDPLMYQGAGHYTLGPCDDITYVDDDWGVDMEGELIVITDDVPLGTSAEDAQQYIRLVGAINDISLRGLMASEIAKNFGFIHGKGATTFTPVVVTLDELDGVWKNGTIDGIMQVDYNGSPMGRTDISLDCTFNMPQLIAHASKARPLCAGTVVGSGTISNRDTDGGSGKPISQGGVGYSCLLEMRFIEQIAYGTAKTPFMKSGDTVRIAVCDKQGTNLFGDIQQKTRKI